ncbi:P-loop containing nucleoside triphosphate hydrolase protein [Mollisia scopiformis]|uniref:DNA 3'-5' helicase n=1 Tax=Mollisia scopiformis TaxID=149040 RepID=A0A194XK65_MOLSC|nr:P-loop containing nucleoside triphosphate hydrolase protein [Mollisia scopiformis]KUJ20600.1 P-loop containing nucleoside triphosphate hydrolase protein [Mollisia scopiformis]
MNPHGLLAHLNPSQQAAVSSFADTLAILAGPGSGKTHTLTSRTAWLLAQGLQPWNVIVATFTVKAAREMKERIGKLIGNGMESKLVLGTFHSIARRYLARYGHLIDIKKDFGIADSADSLAIIKRIIKKNNFIIDAKITRSRISGKKSRGARYRDKENENTSGAKTVEAQEFDICYAEYEEALKRSNLLDYDDLLLRCVDLLRYHPSCVSNVEAVLIDEFQDTNIVQFDLMRLFAAHRKRVTIVGDPDQSIYGFRAAEVKNYKRLLKMYPETVTIALEENYRSSGAILLTSLNIIEQDSSRVAKSLLATHAVGTRPVLRRLCDAHKEAEWIITEIQRIKGLTGELLDLNDFAILLRSSALSRLIESALGKAGIAYRMVGGLRFYDRLEVKTILDYLRVINQPDNNDALARIINVPSRRIGESTIKSLLEEADESKITLWSLILGFVQGKKSAKTKLPKQTDQGLSRFVNIILTARGKLTAPEEERMTMPELIKFILLKTDYETWLEEHHSDIHKARWANVEELITQATDFQDLVSCSYEDESLPQIDGLDQDEGPDHLSRFLANVALASEVKNDEGTATAQVTISTIHAAKGLEWPVVFIPATYQGSIPHSRAEDTNEERRLLYVAMTRAKALLYMSYPVKNSQSELTTLSPFLCATSLAPLLDQRGPSFRSSTVQTMAQILRRALPSATSISKSSAFVVSMEDDIFPLNGEENKDEKTSRWNSMAGNPSFTMGQQAPKRRRVEMNRSVSNIEERSAPDWKPAYHTTMDQSASFTSASITMKSSFVSAGSHLQVLKEQAVDCAAATSLDPAPEDTQSQARKKVAPKAKSKSLEGQGTLFGFLGKPEPKVAELVNIKPPKTTTNRTETSNFPVAAAFCLPRPLAIVDRPIEIAPSLANHRLGGGKTIIRPRQSVPIEDCHRNDYVFLSSSPPRVTRIEPIPEKQPGLVSNPPIMKLVRPVVSMHETSMDKLQSGSAARKTLGVKRSMNGWENRKNQSFKPPTITRPAE